MQVYSLTRVVRHIEIEPQPVEVPEPVVDDAGENNLEIGQNDAGVEDAVVPEAAEVANEAMEAEEAAVVPEAAEAADEAMEAAVVQEATEVGDEAIEAEAAVVVPEAAEAADEAMQP